MPIFTKLGDKATVPDVLKMSPEAGIMLIELHEQIMRGPSSLTPGEREVIAAYVSGLNKCQYCRMTTPGGYWQPGRELGKSDHAADTLQTAQATDGHGNPWQRR